MSPRTALFACMAVAAAFGAGCGGEDPGIGDPGHVGQTEQRQIIAPGVGAYGTPYGGYGVGYVNPGGCIAGPNGYSCQSSSGYSTGYGTGYGYASPGLYGW